MATTYSTSLNLAYIGTGDQSGTWGATTNTNLGLIEQAITGVTSISLSGTSYTLVPLNGVSDVPRNMVLVFGGTPSGNVTVTAPLVQKFYVITNNTAYNIIMAATGGSISLTIPSGITAQCYCDGSTGFYSAQTGSAGNFLVNGNLNVTGNTADVGNLSVSGTATLSGTSTAVTPTLGDNTTKIATTAFVATATSSLGTMSTQNANNVAITGGSINGTTIGNSTASTGAFTTLSASSTVSGIGFSTYLASPPAIGGSTAAAGTFTTLGGTTITASTQFSGPGTGLTGTASSLSINGTSGGLSGTPNISVGTIASGNQTVTTPATTSGAVMSTYGVDVVGTLDGVTYSTWYSPVSLRVNQKYVGYQIFTSNTDWVFTFDGNTGGLKVPGTTYAAAFATTNFTIQESGGQLIFKNGITTIASLDSSGNLIVKGNITAYGTP